MKIGQLAQQTGVSTKAIRYYEQIGVLPEPVREPNGYRAYSDGAANRIQFIRDAQSAGLSLLEIQMILELRDEGHSTCNHVLSRLKMHLHDVETQMRDMARTRDRLADIIERAEALDPTTCNDPNSCQTIPKGTK